MKVSKVITKSKFGAPSTKKRKQGRETTTQTSYSLCNTNQQQGKRPTIVPTTRRVTTQPTLPSIATLKRTSPTNHRQNPDDNSMNHEVLPNDQFTRRYGNLDDAAFHSVMTLTPPSSPLETDGTTLVQDSRERIETVTENVENLVDEHFRNCGIENFTSVAKQKQGGGNESDFALTINKFLKSQVRKLFSIPLRFYTFFYINLF